MRFLPVSLTTMLVELADLDQTLALFASLEANPVPGIRELVPAARTIMIRYQPQETTPQDIAREIQKRDLAHSAKASSIVVEIPVRYDGEDLVDVAELTGLSIEEVIRLHTESEFTVAFCGFAPGFGYLIGGNEALHVPRRKTPRTRIPAGAVALAGAFSGVYPQASPGGWQIIGTTPVKMWDLSRDPPALFQPGYKVRFYDIAEHGDKKITYGRALSVTDPSASTATHIEKIASFEVLAAPMPALFQDLGRFGMTGQGVSASGALDQGALRTANRIVGNPTGLACLEVTMGGIALQANCRALMTVTGAPCSVEITDESGHRLSMPPYRPIAVEPGDTIKLGPASSGMRSYIAVRGGFEVEKVLGSASTDTLALVGPPAVTAGQILTISSERHGLGSVVLHEAPPFEYPSSQDVVTLDVVLGPRTDWFTTKGLASLFQQVWQVTPQSNRVGIRLAAEDPIERRDTQELPSEGTAVGAIQVPHSGQPVLFLADHPLTGGYPVIANVADYHLDLAGQIPINAKIKFRPISSFQDINPGPDAGEHP
ncbi:5-oxoprolinase subunit PxpB [Oryzifoliimicrobium ureilyticus]|uniref:5-oxoprolinase subunit PxpB n=1 Tax=Oryzifoliimicrobium ureilyticus TaxID=3113724 RepID=UPI0030763A70